MDFFVDLVKVPTIMAHILTLGNYFRLIVILTCTLIIGCAGGQSLFGRLPGQLPSASDAPDAPEVFVIRSDYFNYFAMMSNYASHKIVINDQEVFMLPPWGYTNFHIAPGEHRIGIKCFAGWTDGWKQVWLSQQFEVNRVYYFVVKETSPCASIELIDAEKGLTLIKEARDYIPFEYKNPSVADPSKNYPPNHPTWNIWTGGMPAPWEGGGK